MKSSSPQPFPPASRLVAYLRDSGGDRQNLSVEQQEQAVGRWCLERGYVLTRVFRDAARSGTKTAGRDAFLEMVEYLAGSPPEAGVVFWEYARLSRDYDDLMFYVADLRRRGVIVHSISDQVPEGLDGRLMESIQAWKNAKFVDDLRRNVRRGMRHVVVAYHAWIGKVPPLGYRREREIIGVRRDGSPHAISRLAVDPEKAPLVRRAFEMRAEGRTSGEIMQEIKIYHRQKEYMRMLKNEVYAGVYVLPGGERVAEYCEPIVSRELWEAAQRVNERRSAGRGVDNPRALRSSFLLSGLLYCARCGRRMYGSTTCAKSGRFCYYRCSGVEDKICNARQIPKDDLEAAVLESLRAEALNPSELARLAAEIRARDTARGRETAAALESATEGLAETQARARRLVAAIADAGHSRAMLDQLAEIEGHEAYLLRRVAALEADMAPRAAVDLDELKRMAEKVLEITDRSELQLAVRAFVAQVNAERTSGGDMEIEIVYKLPG